MDCQWDEELVCIFCGYRARRPGTNRNCGAPPSMSGSRIFARVSRYASAIARWIAAGRPRRTQDEIDAILTICRGCEKFNGSACNSCGCAINRSASPWWNKLAMATESCPLDPPRWTASGGAEKRDRLRVAFVVPHLVVGGVERWLCDLAEYLPANGVDVAGVAFLGAEHIYEPIMGEEVARFCPIVGAIDRPEVFRVVRPAEAVLAVAAGADVIIAWGLHGEQLEAVQAVGKPTIGVIHGEGTWHQAAGWISDWVAVSPAALRHAPPATLVIPNGVNLARLRPTRSRDEERDAARIPRDARVVVSIGRVSREKRLELAGGALDRLPPDVWLWIIGHGGDQNRIRAAAGPSAHRVVCSPPRQDVGNALAASDAAILLSRDEGYCLAAVEALAAGVPLVATPVGILPQLGGVAEWLPLDPTLGQVADGILAVLASRPRSQREATQIVIDAMYGASSPATAMLDRVARARSLVLADHSAESMARRWAWNLSAIIKGSRSTS